ncbi:MAG: LmeA family phospholipid-binding protein [Anaerolineales bacterium]|nr:LmeA family phospholipid-binding protein [Anaerolineales bacterium]
MNRKPTWIWIFILFVLFNTLACTIFVGGPKYPEERIPISPEAVDSLEISLAEALAESAITGNFSLNVTETQLTSFLANRLATQKRPLFTEPQVYLRDGQIQIYGRVERGPFTATIRILLTAGLDQNGKMTLQLTSADFGPLPVPAGLQEFFTGLLEEAFTGPIGPLATGIRLTEIQIANGTMSLKGQVR